MSKSALILGITGQDGSYLAELLLEKGYEVHGIIRRSCLHPDSLKNIEHLKESVKLHFGDLVHESQICSLLDQIQPKEVYNLAAQSDVRISFDIPEYTANVTGLGVVRLLEAIRRFSPDSRVYQASSSEMFGDSPPPQSEETSMRPRSPYGAAKYFAHNMCNIYREGYHLFICCGILFNHESPRRGKNFVTRKIASAIGEIKRGEREILQLGNTFGTRDWGWAPDYVYAMWLMLQQPKPDDFVIGTGEAHTVQELVEEAFPLAGLDWKNYVVIDPDLYRPVEVNYLLADARKARETLHWQPSVSFEGLVKLLVEAELK